MLPYSLRDEENRTANALREAINAAIKAGNTPGEVRSIVNDQLFAIKYLGAGDVDLLLQREAELEMEKKESGE